MSTLVLVFVLPVLVVISFLLGFAFCMIGINHKIVKIESTSHHNGMKWIKFKEEIK